MVNISVVEEHSTSTFRVKQFSEFWNLKVEVLCCSETSVAVHQLKCCNILEALNLQIGMSFLINWHSHDAVACIKICGI
jgi:hypothetical protein